MSDAATREHLNVIDRAHSGDPKCDQWGGINFISASKCDETLSEVLERMSDNPKLEYFIQQLIWVIIPGMRYLSQEKLNELIELVNDENSKIILGQEVILKVRKELNRAGINIES